MAEDRRMTAAQVVDKVMGSEHVDVVRESVAWLVGELIELAIPKLRSGSYFPSFLEPRKRSEQALVAVVQEAYVNGVWTRKVDRLVERLGVAGIDKDAVSRLCRGLDEQVRVFRERPLDGRYP
jgi:putative transposase